MTNSERAEEAVKALEQTLRMLLSDAAAAGDFSEVLAIAGLAQRISQASSVTNGASPAITVKEQRKGQRPKSKKGYPIFARRGATLVRIAWSKAEKKEYEHKADRAVLVSLCAELDRIAAKGRIFPSSDLFPLLSADAEIQRNQVYAWLGFLKQVGLIEQHGRQGYSVPALDGLESSAQQAFRSLPKR